MNGKRQPSGAEGPGRTRLGRLAAAAAGAATMLALVSAGAAPAAPGGDTKGCAAVLGLYESGNPGITTAAGTPFGYGACGFGVPGGPRP